MTGVLERQAQTTQPRLRAPDGAPFVWKAASLCELQTLLENPSQSAPPSRNGLLSFYSPGLGRWINRDPIGERGGVNLYAAFLNSPTNYVDTDGRFPVVVAVVVIGGAYMAGQAIAPTAANAPTSKTDPVYGPNERFLPSMGPEAQFTTPLANQTYYGPNHFDYYTPEERLAVQYHERFHRDQQSSIHRMQNSRDAELKAWWATLGWIDEQLSNPCWTEEQRSNWEAARANAKILIRDYNSQPRSAIDLYGRPY